MHRLGALALVLASSACAVPSLDYADFDGALATARCERLVTCGLAASTDACLRVQPARPDPNTDAALRDGKLVYRGDYARQCVDALAALDCDDTSHAARALPDACRFMFEGKLDQGDTCNFDSECASRRCDVTSVAGCTETSCCPGTCGDAALGAEGEPCTRGVDCAAGLYCDPDATCHVVGEDGDSCLVDTQCDFGLACAGGICAMAVGLGEPCAADGCADLGAYCDASSACSPPGLDGDPCDDTRPCSSLLACDGGSCKPLPSVGQTCAGRCAAGSWCNPISNRCETPLPDGSPCEAGVECQSGQCSEGDAFDSCQTVEVCD